MAYKINADECSSCGACEPECPNQAIAPHKGAYAIDPAKCTECEGQADEPQCVAVCASDCISQV